MTVTDLSIFGLGVGYTVLLALAVGFKEWDVPLYYDGKYNIGGTYTPISFESLPIFITLCVIAVAAYLLLRFSAGKLPPMIAAFCYGGMALGFVLTAVVTVQLWSDITEFATWLFLLFPYNYILCSIRLVKNTASLYAQKIAENEYHNRLLQRCKAILSKSVSFTVFSFFLWVPMLLVVMMLLTLFGQQPDSIVKAFTETAEWTLSQKIPPPRLEYGGHYLCTVAACGDERVVKPLRAGKRRGELIIVNRQLLVANAFEDLIAEKAPGFHKIIRRIYDKTGLPISKHITTKKRSNMVYFIMKPLEWLFLLTLYTLDTEPENRICKQYSEI